MKALFSFPLEGKDVLGLRSSTEVALLILFELLCLFSSSDFLFFGALVLISRKAHRNGADLCDIVVFVCMRVCDVEVLP